MDKKRVALIGVTGSVGQEFVQSLNNPPMVQGYSDCSIRTICGKKVH